MKKFVVLLLTMTAPAVYAGAVGHCDVYDRETGKFISTISFDLEAKRVCWDIKCKTGVVIASGSFQGDSPRSVEGITRKLLRDVLLQFGQ